MPSPVLLTKITPPPPGANILPRPRILRALQPAYQRRLTLLQAGAGYGKSVALAEFSRAQEGVIWYQAAAEDNDPLVFLLHLNHAIRQAFPTLSDLPLETLQHWDGTQSPLPWRDLTDQTLNALSALPSPALLLLDDAHLLLENGEIPHLLDRLIGRAPQPFHILLAGRPTLRLPSLSHWRARGEAAPLEQSTLAFTPQEISALFAAQYRLELSTEEVQRLAQYTEGWAIALQLAWQNLRRQPGWQPPAPLSDSQEALFDLLTREVLDQQPADVRHFLLLTATLRELNPAACNHLRAETDSHAMLAYLRRQDLFLTESAGGVLHYHPIFHDFLRAHQPPAQRPAWHQSAAAYFLQHNDPEAALYHLWQAGQWQPMAEMLDSYAATLLAAGRLDNLGSYLALLPPETLLQRPGLLFTLGDLARLHSRFEEAQGWYKQAEALWRARSQPDGIARALRGQARVYLDTVNPAAAERLLEEALRLSDGFEDRESQVRLYELLAENKLNAGHPQEAERLRQRAEELRLAGPSNDSLLFRVLLRTGRLAEARQGLEELAKTEQTNPSPTPRAHRETLLLLSLIYSLTGRREEALAAAEEGARRGEELKSPFVTAVGWMRQGHALALLEDDRAEAAYQQCVEISRSLSVPRLRVEANWGLCRFYGYRGDLTRAQLCAQEAVEIATQAGDEWIASLTRLTMGASLTLAKRYEAAQEWLTRAASGFLECSDPFGRAAAGLWLSLLFFQQRQNTRLTQTLPSALALLAAGDYGFLPTRASLLGAPEERIFFPLLLHARQNGWEAAYAQRLLEESGLPALERHPGYRLRVQTLGNFHVWRGREEIPANAWRREKARQLFQILLAQHGNPINRDQMSELLWPEADPLTAGRNFKVTLNALYQVLEPERDPGSESAFIGRDESAYFLRPGADTWLDSEEFSRLLKAGKTAPALALYTGEYLPSALYEPWAAEERERLASLFLEHADRLAVSLLEQGNYQAAIDLCQRILAQDNCWERAYRLLMQAYHALGDRGQAVRAYQRCAQTLRAELDVTPSAETERLYRLVSGREG